MEKINNAIIKLQKKFRKKVRLSNLLKRELDILHNIIIKIINNINFNYLIRRINNDELIKLNNKVIDLYNLNKKIRLEINFLNL